jgi:twitching motility protein PilT
MGGKTAGEIINIGFAMGASDIHISVDHPPAYRMNDRLFFRPEDEALDAQETRNFGEEMMPNLRIRQILEDDGQVDFAQSFPGKGRGRVNLYIQGGHWAAAVRIIPALVPQLNDLGLPATVQKLTLQERGLILVTGATGSGKSTTLAGMIDLLNHHQNRHVITLEDPIEYVHQHGTCIVNQREVGSDTRSFALGLRAALRQDPDIIMVGEMRDLETISIAMTAAETGHLVLASLHSGSAVQTLNRVIDVFPPHQQSQVRMQLATSLLGIISQQLIPSRDGDSRVLAAEILIMNSAIRNLIRENKIHQIFSAIQTGSSLGMISMDKALRLLGQQKRISSHEVNKRLGAERYGD